MNISGLVWNIQKTQIALEHNTKTKGDMVRNSKQLMQWWAFLAGNWELESDVFISPVKEGLLQGMKISVKKHRTLFRVSWMVQDQDQSLHYWPLLAELWHHPITEHQSFFFPPLSLLTSRNWWCFLTSHFLPAFWLLSVTGRIIAQGNGRRTLFLRESWQKAVVKEKSLKCCASTNFFLNKSMTFGKLESKTK